VSVTSAAEFQQAFGALDAESEPGDQVGCYFANGGVVAWVVRTGRGTGWKRGIRALGAIPSGALNLLCLPGASALPSARHKDVVDTALSYCERRRAFLVLDPPSSITDAGAMATYRNGDGFPELSPNGAIYFPSIDVAGRRIGPSGAVAGRYAAIDACRAVWTAPAGTDAPLDGATLPLQPSAAESSDLNSMGVNVLRSLPGSGTLIWGARTLAGADAGASEWKYVNVRRLALFIEDSIDQGTQWARFEPNAEPLWASIRLSVGTFLHRLFRDGAFPANTPRDAYFVRCDQSTMSQTDIDNGNLIMLVGIAPVRPAEFVVFRIQQKTLTP
jgi:phage tail sheath protein FI